MMDRATNIVWQDASNNVLRSFGYSFNAMGMITQKVAMINGQPTTNSYAYDNLDRLISETVTSASPEPVERVVNYAYDLAGNRMQMVQNGETISYTIGLGNKLSSWGVDGTNSSMEYDAAGNVTSINYNASNQVSLSWDSRYRVTAAYTNGGLAEAYTYDALGRRISTSDGTTTNYLVYDGNQVIAETDASGTPLKSYTYGPGIDNILAMTVYGSTTSTYYYVKDHLGSVQAIVDSSGSIVESYQYDAWGNVLEVKDGSGVSHPSSVVGNRYTWQGREISWATRLYYFRARWYDPVTARWLSNDPIGISGGLNQYVFCADNPVNFVDPWGLCETGPKSPGYWDRYWQHVSAYAVNPGPAAWGLFGGVWPKSWAPVTGGRPPLLGSDNPLTSVLRAIGIPGAGSVIVRTGAAGIGVVTVGAGFYNVGVFVSGFGYAAFPGSNGLTPTGGGGLFGPDDS